MIMNKQTTSAMRGIAIIMMLVHHLFTWGGAAYTSFFEVTLWGGHDIPMFFGIFGKLCVTLYLFLSGYGFCCKFGNEKYTGISGAERWRIAWKVYKKYLIVFAIFIPIGFLLSIRRFQLTEFIWNLIPYDTTYDAECWFLLIYILIVLLVLPILVQKKSSWSVKKIFLISLAVIVSGYAFRVLITVSPYSSFKNTRLYFNIYYFLLSQFAFVVGWVCKQENFFERFGHLYIPKVIWVIAMFILMILKVYCPGGMLIDTLLTPVFIGLCLRIVAVSKTIFKVLTVIGSYSTYMWMTHTYFSIYYWSDFIYAFKWPLLITAVLILVSLVTALVLDLLEEQLIKITRKARIMGEIRWVKVEK